MGMIETQVRKRIDELVAALDPMIPNMAVEKELEAHLRLLRLFDRDEPAAVDRPKKSLGRRQGRRPHPFIDEDMP